MTRIKVLRLVAVQVAHSTREIAVGRLDEEVVMIAHEAVGVEDEIVRFDHVFKPIEKSFSIAIGEKDVLLCVAASNDVIEGTVEFDAKRSCHRVSL